jgi:hypothetical protein
MISFMEKESELEWWIHGERRIDSQNEGFRGCAKELVVISVVMRFKTPGNCEASVYSGYVFPHGMMLVYVDWDDVGMR